MSSTRAYLRALALARTGLDEVLTLTNRALAADMEGNYFVTLLYARLSPRPLSLSYTNAGHLPGYVMNAAGDLTSQMPSTAMPLGVMADGEFPVAPSIELQSGDLVLIFTDGVIEASAPDGTSFGTDRALQIMRDNRSRSAAELVDVLHEAVKGFTKQPFLEDDLTAVIIKVI
jgi:serine phosphatase RsbU (regulator of sigma subunit)